MPLGVGFVVQCKNVQSMLQYYIATFHKFGSQCRSNYFIVVTAQHLTEAFAFLYKYFIPLLTI